ncbi:hypothetical protein Peur_010554 [Populus x canadensis]
MNSGFVQIEKGTGLKKQITMASSGGEEQVVSHGIVAAVRCCSSRLKIKLLWLSAGTREIGLLGFCEDELKLLLSAWTGLRAKDAGKGNCYCCFLLRQGCYCGMKMLLSVDRLKLCCQSFATAHGGLGQRRNYWSATTHVAVAKEVTVLVSSKIKLLQLL